MDTPTPNPDRPRPLAGVKVLDLSRVLAYSAATKGMVYVTSGGAIAFLNMDGTLDKVYTPAAGTIQTLAVHPTASTVWFTKWTNVSGSNSLSYGLLQADGTLVGEATYGGTGIRTNIAPDPGDATGLRALFLDTETGGGRIIAVQSTGGSSFDLSASRYSTTVVPDRSASTIVIRVTVGTPRSVPHSSNVASRAVFPDGRRKTTFRVRDSVRSIQTRRTLDRSPRTL